MILMNYEQSFVYCVIDSESRQEKGLTGGFIGFTLFLLILLNIKVTNSSELLFFNSTLGIVILFLFCALNNVIEKFGSLKHSVLTKEYNTVIGQYLCASKEYAYFMVDNIKYQVYFVPEELNFLKEYCLQGTEIPLYAVATGNNNLSRIYGCLASCYSN